MINLATKAVIALLLADSTNAVQTRRIRNALYVQSAEVINTSNQEKLFIATKNMNDDLKFDEIKDFSYDVAGQADKFKTLFELDEEKKAKEAQLQKQKIV